MEMIDLHMLYHGENKLFFDKMMILTDLYLTNMLRWILKLKVLLSNINIRQIDCLTTHVLYSDPTILCSYFIKAEYIMEK